MIEKVDHKNMNMEVDFMQGRMASAEIITMAIWEQLEQPVLLMGAELHCVKLMETENNIAEYYGGWTLFQL